MCHIYCYGSHAVYSKLESKIWIKPNCNEMFTTQWQEEKIYNLCILLSSCRVLNPKTTANTIISLFKQIGFVMFRVSWDLRAFCPIVCFQFSTLCSPAYYFRQCGNLKQSLKKKRKRRSDRTVKGKKKKKQWEKGSRKGLTVRENVRLIEASFAQLFLVAVPHSTERLERIGSRCDLAPSITRQ